MIQSWEYLVSAKGSDRSASYPYASAQSNVAGTCKASTARIGTTISSTGISVAPTEEAFMEALVTIGPIAVVRIVLIQCEIE